MSLEYLVVAEGRDVTKDSQFTLKGNQSQHEGTSISKDETILIKIAMYVIDWKALIHF